VVVVPYVMNNRDITIPPMAIRTKEPDVPSDLPPAKLYLDDIAEIVETLSASLPEEEDEFGEVVPITVRFEVGQKECDTLDDLQKMAKVSTKFEVLVKRKRAMASLHANGHHAAWIWYGLEGEVPWITARKLQTIFKQRERSIRSRLGRFDLLAILVALSAFSLLIRNTKASILIFFGLLALTIGSVTAFRGHTIVILRYRNEKQAGRDERIEKILYIALTAVLSVAGTLLVTFLIHKIWP
jgi:hypothetical protein